MTGPTIKTNISTLLEMAGQAERFDRIGAALSNKRKTPLSEYQASVFADLDRLAAWVDNEVKRIGRPLTAEEFYDVIRRGVDAFEEELNR